VGCSPLERNQFVPISIPIQGIRDANIRHALDAVRKSLQSVAHKTMTWMNLTGFWAKITGPVSSGKHPWISVDPDSTGAFAAPTYQPMASSDPGLDNAFEENGVVSTLTNRIVWMKPRISSDGQGLTFFFAVPLTSAGGTITITRTNEDGSTTTFSGVDTINISNQSGFDGSQSSNTVNIFPNDEGPSAPGTGAGGLFHFSITQAPLATAVPPDPAFDISTGSPDLRGRHFAFHWHHGETGAIDTMAAGNGINTYFNGISVADNAFAGAAHVSANYTFQWWLISGVIKARFSVVPATGGGVPTKKITGSVWYTKKITD
jgi:hypothetical protein